MTLDSMLVSLSGFWATVNSTERLMLSMAAFAVAVTALEGFALGRIKKDEPYDWAAFGTTLRINGWRILVEAVPMGIVMGAAIPFGQWFYDQRLWTVDMNTWYGWPAMFLVTEFFYYWLHRSGHRIRWYWASHQVHHSGNQYNLAAAFRQSITGKISGGFVFFAPQCWLGFTPEVVAASYAFNLIYQFWIHTDLVPKLGWMEGVFNTPSAHRVHHAANVEYLDANYGGTIMLFDRIFGTYVPEKDGVPIRYGLVNKVTTYSAIKICLFEWANIFRDVGRSVMQGRLGDALGYMLMPPGWAPNGQGLTTEALRAQMQGLTGQAAGVPPEELVAKPQVLTVSTTGPSHAPAR